MALYNLLIKFQPFSNYVSPTCDLYKFLIEQFLPISLGETGRLHSPRTGSDKVFHSGEQAFYGEGSE